MVIILTKVLMFESVDFGISIDGNSQVNRSELFWMFDILVDPLNILTPNWIPFTL